MLIDRISSHRIIGLLVVLATVVLSTSAQAQNFSKLGTEFQARRPVAITDELRPIAVVEFMHHGQISDEADNVAVFESKSNEPLPMRVLQLGPGDFCRIAFATQPNQRVYELFYGGEPIGQGSVPELKADVGLVLETREFRQCNLNSVDSVKEAFDRAKPIGADYVGQVHHSSNPFSLSGAPFMSHYQGTLTIPKAGQYAFYTSSQDCSFLLIDGKTAASAPGRHGPQRRAQPNMRKPIRLTAGPHRFDYYHVATSSAAVMAAAWEVTPKGEKPAPVAIPADAFQSGAITRAEAGPLSLPDATATADFLFKITGDVPLPDNPHPLIGVEFKLNTAGSLASTAQVTWDFGDGQTSETRRPVHVFLKPGFYDVTLTMKQGQREHVVTNRIQVERPFLTNRDSEKFHQLDMYLPVLDTYDPAQCDGPALLQLVLAYLWRAEQLTADADDLRAKVSDFSSEMLDPEEAADFNPQRAMQQAAAMRVQAHQAITRAVEVGKTGVLAPQSKVGGRELYEIVLMIGPSARDIIGDAKLAGQIWHGAASRLASDLQAAECEAVAADIALNDLLNVPAANVLLAAAKKRLGANDVGDVASLVRRVEGDYHAATGDGDEARQAYREAEELYQAAGSFIERTAWQGAYSRSAEHFLKTAELDRAIVELRAWQDDFPSDKNEGYLDLLMARYWQGRKMYPQAVAVADRMLTVNPDSPYMDQLLMLSVECDVARDEKIRAIATLHSLIKDYPGSPLIPEAKARLAELEAE